MLDQYSSLFREGLETLKQTKVKFFLKEGITPKFYKARPVPLALQQRVTAELDCLQAEGILCPIKVSDWAIPIVPVMKKDGTIIRVCGDFKLTVNQESMSFLPPYQVVLCFLPWISPTCIINYHWMRKLKS